MEGAIFGASRIVEARNAGRARLGVASSHAESTVALLSPAGKSRELNEFDVTVRVKQIAAAVVNSASIDRKKFAAAVVVTDLWAPRNSRQPGKLRPPAKPPRSELCTAELGLSRQRAIHRIREARLIPASRAEGQR